MSDKAEQRAKPLGNAFIETLQASYDLTSLGAHLALARDDYTGTYKEAARADLSRVRASLDKIDRALTAASTQRREAA